jgi:hypothetical protein
LVEVQTAPPSRINAASLLPSADEAMETRFATGAVVGVQLRAGAEFKAMRSETKTIIPDGKNLKPSPGNRPSD